MNFRRRQTRINRKPYRMFAVHSYFSAVPVVPIVAEVWDDLKIWDDSKVWDG